jgi:YD repeat-containing protein
MTCDLRAEQSKRDRGKKKYERREEQRIRSETWVNYDARGALIEIEAACISLFRFAAHRRATLFGA